MNRLVYRFQTLSELGGDLRPGIVHRLDKDTSGVLLVARTDLLDCGIHGKSWDLLRRTRMPAVRLEVGYVTHPGDAARLADPAFRDTVAEAATVAIQRLFLPPEEDQPTGVLRLPELIR